jgi:predicted DNA-binding protein (MmcQ/YjbR family)
MKSDDPVDQLRVICLALPEAWEKLSHGEPSWFAGKSQFAMLDNHHHNGPHLGVWLKAGPGVQELLVEARPDRFYRPPYVGVRGWIGVILEGDIEWDEIAELVEDSYRLVAPKRLVARLASPAG